MNPERGHHIFCNYFVQPVEDCRMCKRLWKEYPYDSGDDMGEFMQKHFPDARALTPLPEKLP